MMKDLLATVFNDWDVHNLGYIEKRTFVHVIHALGLHFTTHQMNCMFRAIDPDLNGRIFFDEFWVLLVEPLTKAIELLKSHFEFKKAHDDMLQTRDMLNNIYSPQGSNQSNNSSSYSLDDNDDDADAEMMMMDPAPRMSSKTNTPRGKDSVKFETPSPSSKKRGTMMMMNNDLRSHDSSIKEEGDDEEDNSEETKTARDGDGDGENVDSVDSTGRRGSGQFHMRLFNKQSSMEKVSHEDEDAVVVDTDAADWSTSPFGEIGVLSVEDVTHINKNKVKNTPSPSKRTSSNMVTPSSKGVDSPVTTTVTLNSSFSAPSLSSAKMASFDEARLSEPTPPPPPSSSSHHHHHHRQSRNTAIGAGHSPTTTTNPSAGARRQKRVTITPSGSGKEVTCKGSFETVEEFFAAMTPHAPSGSGF
jgi:Ca2+-binding EF-hand superfamily protein